MSINNNILYNRELSLDGFKSSCFLLGPRMTGKTQLLKKLKSAYFLDLLDPENELKYIKQPRLLWEELQSVKAGSLAIIDEIQRAPHLLDYVQMGIEERNIRFLLSGSSARKLKRGFANLLGGRAIALKLHALSEKELGRDFSIYKAITFGTLPKIATLIKEGSTNEAVHVLRSYVTIYLKEEIQAEALVRRLDSFQRFLDVAAQSNGSMIEFDNIARECQVAAATVKQYYQILEDTLLGSFLWPWNRSERKKARPKFYFFDCGVVRAIQESLTSKPSSEERGILFETWFFNELIRIRDYKAKEHRFSLWREERHEIDFIVERGKKPILALECKSGVHIGGLNALREFRAKFPKVPAIIVSLQDEHKRKLDAGIEIWPYQDVLELYRAMS